MSVKELARKLKLSIWKIYRMIHGGDIKAEKVAGRWEVDRKSRPPKKIDRSRPKNKASDKKGGTETKNGPMAPLRR